MSKGFRLFLLYGMGFNGVINLSPGRPIFGDWCILPPYFFDIALLKNLSSISFFRDYFDSIVLFFIISSSDRTNITFSCIVFFRNPNCISFA